MIKVRREQGDSLVEGVRNHFFPQPPRREMEIENLRKPSELAILVAADFLFSRV